MDRARCCDIEFMRIHFIFLFFFLNNLLWFCPKEKGSPCLVVSELQLTEDIVVWDLQVCDIVLWTVWKIIFTLKILWRLVFCDLRRSKRNRSISAFPSILLLSCFPGCSWSSDLVELVLLHLHFSLNNEHTTSLWKERYAVLKISAVLCDVQIFQK